MNIDIYQTDSKNNIQFLRDTLVNVSEQLYIKTPAEGKWSIQQILDHLAVTESVIVNLSHGPASENGRDATAVVNIIKEAFGDHTKVFPNPQPVNPSGQLKSIEEFLNLIERNRLAFLDEIQSKGAQFVLDLFPHPLTGTMTRLEWLYFNIYHTERHIHQIKMIKQNPSLA